MILSSLSLTNFRNYTKVNLDFGQVNILVGPNASGKTNLLEAIYFLSRATSPRLRYQKDLIKNNNNFFRIESSAKSNNRRLDLAASLELKNNETCETKFRLNKKLRKTSDFISQLKTVFFLPSEISLIDSSPVRKRSYFNNVLIQTRPLYYQTLIRLSKIIYARNRLLEALKIGKSKEKELLFWDQELASCGISVFLDRRQVINFINRIIEPIYKKLTVTADKLSIIYQPFLPNIEGLDREAMEKKYQEELFKLRKEEIKQTCSLLGPHRDDFIFNITGKPLASFGSRGEFREAVLALKLSEGKLIEKVAGDKPILLLDDVASELDNQKKDYLFRFLKKYIASDGQIFITTTSLKTINPEILEKAKVFQVEKGELCLFN